MNIKWKNVVVMFVVVLAIVLLILSEPLRQVVAVTLLAIGPGHETEDRVIGLATLALIGVLIVALVRALSGGSGSGGDRH